MHERGAYVTTPLRRHPLVGRLRLQLESVCVAPRNRSSESVSYTHFDLPVVCMIHTMKSADLCKLLEKAGWVLTRTRGSHRQYTKDGRTVTVPHPKKDLGVGLVRAIRKQAGL